MLVREMMFGWRDCFQYFECAKCGCLQIDSVPDDLARYYPDDYYSYASQRDLALKSYLKRRWCEHHTGEPNIIGWALTVLRGPPWFPEWLSRVDVQPDAAVLDVGCGTGGLLLHLRDAGFRDLTGVDPYVSRSIKYRNGVTVLRETLAELTRKYDFVTLHHSFEHMDNPHEVLAQLSRLVSRKGWVLIRTPIAQSYAHSKYCTHWVQIDAPRHLIVHSEVSLRIAAANAGFIVRDVVYDSTAFQFWGSLQYENDIPLRSPQSYAVNPERSMFGEKEIRMFEEHAEDLNAVGRGDQACFYLQKA